MKKCFLILILLSGLSVSAQKNYADILKSTNISEIENFLRTAHPDDPRRTVLKPKLISLRNSQWAKNRNSPVRSLKPLIVEIPKSVLKQRNNDEAEEFKKLLEENSKNHEGKTVKLLNQLFNSDVSSKEVILLMQNNSDCNMIVRIQGNDYYNLAVPAHGENSLVLKKGDYLLKSNVCDAQYASNKHIEKSTLVVLNKPVVQLASSSGIQNRGGVTN
ncbi:DUF6759 domain-containing protein [Kaistella palustris]|uniref:DUF6759 domain-containing protein n=1 Tax=Kaistella palustris TaxID=493376 RepID=UPI0003F5C377|nr:DUF6759 domain-containing protein [Kaistella palustris]